MVVAGGDGIVYTWDLRMRRVMSQMRDHANVSPSALAVSPDGAYLSTGSGAGVVNVYQRHGSKTAGGLTSAAGVPLKSPPVLGGAASQGRPLKEIMNLTTEVDSLVFSHDSQVC
jgi:U3 small nucleolar RNA-associated protein 18